MCINVRQDTRGPGPPAGGHVARRYAGSVRTTPLITPAPMKDRSAKSGYRCSTCCISALICSDLAGSSRISSTKNLISPDCRSMTSRKWQADTSLFFRQMPRSSSRRESGKFCAGRHLSFNVSVAMYRPRFPLIGSNAANDLPRPNSRLSKLLCDITDQHSTAGRATSRVGITRTVPPGRSVAVRGYSAAGWPPGLLPNVPQPSG